MTEHLHHALGDALRRVEETQGSVESPEFRRRATED